MYKSLSIRNFRHFENLEITGFERLNLITGVNNVGKTALLEAIFTLCGAPSPVMVNRINRSRGIASLAAKDSGWDESPWDSIFPYFDSSLITNLSTEMEHGESRSVELRVLRDPSELEDAPTWVKRDLSDDLSSLTTQSGAFVLQLKYQQGTSTINRYLVNRPASLARYGVATEPSFPAYMLSDLSRVPAAFLATLFGKLETRGEEYIVLEALRIVEPRLKRLTTVYMGRDPILHGQLEHTRLIPLPLMGGGTARLAELACHLANCRGGVLLIDEIENGLHHSVLGKVWLTLGKLAEDLDVQVFATTHSDECIQAAHEAFSEMLDYNFCLFRLDRVDGRIVPVALMRDKLEAAIESNIEVRGYE